MAAAAGAVAPDDTQGKSQGLSTPKVTVEMLLGAAHDKKLFRWSGVELPSVMLQGRVVAGAIDADEWTVCDDTGTCRSRLPRQGLSGLTRTLDASKSPQTSRGALRRAISDVSLAPPMEERCRLAAKLRGVVLFITAAACPAGTITLQLKTVMSDPAFHDLWKERLVVGAHVMVRV